MSRDRGTDYAAAAREAAPQAIQIADRFHLVRNVADVLKLLLARCRAEIRRSEPATLPEPEAKASREPTRTLPSPATWKQKPPQQMVRVYQANLAQREDRFQQVVSLRARGMKQADIAKRVGISERTVRKWLKAGALPSYRRPHRRSVFDPYAAYVLERWKAGVHDGKQLFEEIRSQGFKGSARVVGRFLQTLREDGVCGAMEQESGLRESGKRENRSNYGVRTFSPLGSKKLRKEMRKRHFRSLTPQGLY